MITISLTFFIVLLAIIWYMIGLLTIVITTKYFEDATVEHFILGLLLSATGVLVLFIVITAIISNNWDKDLKR